LALSVVPIGAERSEARLTATATRYCGGYRK
jgi:hypothetical protein